MIVEERIYPYSLALSAEYRIRKLNSAILTLKEHMNQFGKNMEVEAPKAYNFINTKIDEMERELKIRKDFPFPYINIPSSKY